MHTNTFSIAARDGLILHGKTWIPENDITSVICIIHGFGGHIGHYENFSGYMTGKGHAVTGLDLRGHGKSGGNRGYVKSGELLMSDINDLLVEARRNYLDLPVFLFGHSMGGNLAAQYILRHRSKELTGIILSSPMFRIAFGLPFGKILSGRIFSHLFPGFTLSYGPDPEKKRSKGIADHSRTADPLVHNRISYQLYKYCIEGGQWSIENASLNKIPALVYHGAKDRITSWQASREFCENSGKHVKFKLWEEIDHEPHNDVKKEQVFEFIDQWIAGIIHR